MTPEIERRRPGGMLVWVSIFSILFVAVRTTVAAEPQAPEPNQKAPADESSAPAESQKAKVAIFPLAGDAAEDLRAKVGFSLRSKLDREQTYDVIDGYTMADAVAVSGPVTLQSDLAEVQKRGEALEAEILIWGELSGGPEGSILRLRIFDVMQLDPRPHELEHVIARATDLRFVSEKILAALPDVRQPEAPNEIAVRADPSDEARWASGANLVANPGFEADGDWNFLYLEQNDPIKAQPRLPLPDEAVIATVDGARVLAMRMSRTAAETNGLAVLSSSIPIEPGVRYRLGFRFRSDGPRARVFVKGYTMAEDINGKPTEREVYRRQVPPVGNTDGRWVEVIDELNPRHVAFPVQSLRVDLYVYLQPGMAMFDDVTLKAVGEQLRPRGDAAIDPPVTRPAVGP